MTYALAWPLQEALFRLLRTSPEIGALVGDRVFDAPPALDGTTVPEGVYVTLGDETAEDWSTAGDGGASHLVTLSVNAPRRGFSEAKQVAGAISDLLLGGGLALSRGSVVDVRFVDARTRREEAGALRRIELRFRIVIEDTGD